MRIAIIGAGNVGGALARACVAAGHDVVLSARHAERAVGVAAEVGGRAAASNPEAVEGADMVVLAVPSTAVAPVLDEIAGRIGGKVVADPTKRPLADEKELFEASESVAEGIRFLAPEAAVVKAFNPLDVGGLLAARALELMAVLHIGLNARNGWPWQSGWKLLGPRAPVEHARRARASGMLKPLRA
jgi:predicted dinucleotide-binding enzyme